MAACKQAILGFYYWFPVYSALAAELDNIHHMQLHHNRLLKMQNGFPALGWALVGKKKDESSFAPGSEELQFSTILTSAYSKGQTASCISSVNPAVNCQWCCFSPSGRLCCVANTVGFYWHVNQLLKTEMSVMSIFSLCAYISFHIVVLS